MASPTDKVYEKLKDQFGNYTPKDPASARLAKKTGQKRRGGKSKRLKETNRKLRKMKFNSFINGLKSDWQEFQIESRKSKSSFWVKRSGQMMVFSASFTLSGAAVMGFAGEYLYGAYRNIVGSESYELRLSDVPDRKSKLEPLYIDTVEVNRTIALQENLLTLGYATGPCGANGVFTQEDMRAVNWFRAAAGLKPSQFADQETLSMIELQAKRRQELRAVFENKSGKARTMQVFEPSVFTPSLEEKAQIRAIQADLYQAGYSLGDCKFTGVIDADTAAAIEQFKQDHRILPISASVDADVRLAIRAAAEKSAASSATAEISEKQGMDKLASILYGKVMTDQEVKDLALEYVGRGIDEYIVQAIMEASLKTGMDFTYLMDINYLESSHKPWAEAATSTAVGPFQFIESTWLSTFRKHAGKYGYAKLVSEMDKPAQKKYVLELRKDVKLSALLASEFALENLARLQNEVGGTIGKPDLYMAHFLGAGGAADFIREFRKNPDAQAAAKFPGPAGSNAVVFYHDGQKKTQPKTMGEVYKIFAAKMSSRVLRMTNAQAPKKLTDALSPA